MKTLTLYREDFNNPLHPDLWDSMLEDLGIDTHVKANGKTIPLDIESVTLRVIVEHAD